MDSDHDIAIQRGCGEAVWRQIELKLEQDIARAVFPPGERLPPETELAQRFGVNRHTVRQAMAALQNRGLVRIEQGRGTFVEARAIDYSVGRRTRFSENLLRQKREGRHRLLRSDQFAARGAIARGLGLRAGVRVIMLETLSEVSGRPMSLAAHHFPAKRFAGLMEAFRDTQSITRALQRLGVEDYTRKLTRVTTRMPTLEEARLLQQPKTRPILQAEGINVDPYGEPIEYGVTRFAGDWVQLVFEPD